MQCPRCATETTVRRVQEVDADSCAKCGGVFLDRGELNRVAESTEGDLEFSTLHEDSAGHPDSFGPTDCPRCEAGGMQKVEFLIHTGIVLDHCAGCGGFWLDGKELERINAYVHELNEASKEFGSAPMDWFARFLYALPR